MSKPIRIVQVSDTHLSRKRAYFHDNWEVFLAEMAANPPDLIVASGDLSFDGADDDDDLAFARLEYDQLPAPWIAIPGNHDIGESTIAVRLDQPIDDTRIARWKRHIGPQWWSKDVGDWRLVGIDTVLLGSSRPEEEEQWRFLQAALAERGGRPVLLFQHMPPWLTERTDPSFTTLALPHVVRGRLLETCAAGGVRAIACGHVHVHNRAEYEGIEIVWASATSFFNIIERQHIGFGVPRAGYIEWTLDGAAIAWRVVEPPLMITHDIGVWNKVMGSTTKMPPRALR
jgi:3',5'-cyclic AMP phosphodiesterase CpdA